MDETFSYLFCEFLNVLKTSRKQICSTIEQWIIIIEQWIIVIEQWIIVIEQWIAKHPPDNL